MKRHKVILYIIQFFLLVSSSVVVTLDAYADNENVRKLLEQVVAAEKEALNPSSETESHEKVTTKELVGEDVLDFSHIAKKTAKGFIYCVAAVLLGFSLFKRFNSKTSPIADGAISIVARKALGPNTHLLITEVEGKKLLLAQTQGDIKLIADISSPDSFDHTLSEVFSSSADEQLQTSKRSING